MKIVEIRLTWDGKFFALVGYDGVEYGSRFATYGAAERFALDTPWMSLSR